jgi:hypothetical protein
MYHISYDVDRKLGVSDQVATVNVAIFSVTKYQQPSELPSALWFHAAISNVQYILLQPGLARLCVAQLSHNMCHMRLLCKLSYLLHEVKNISH